MNSIQKREHNVLLFLAYSQTPDVLVPSRGLPNMPDSGSSKGVDRLRYHQVWSSAGCSTNGILSILGT